MENLFEKQNEFVGKKVKPVPTTQPEIGIDTEKTITDNVLYGAETSSLDINSLNNLLQSAQNREQSYELIDAMACDDVIAAVLETYAEDTVQPNDKGQIVWVEAENNQIYQYTSWLLDSLNIDKHMYQWAYQLITYGDVYVRLFRKSDEEEDKLFKKPASKSERQLNEAIVRDMYGYDTIEDKDKLNEDIKLHIYADSDPYVPYIEMVDNPGEMFDLQKFGKTHGYIQAPVRMVQHQTDVMYNYETTHYKVRKQDLNIFDGTSFVHGCLENTNQRQPETVQIFLNENADLSTEDTDSISYKVKRGQSILYNAFKIWRELNLLEMSAMLNRLTKSSVVRVIGVEVGDMPKEQVQNYLHQLKEKIEQKSAINTDKTMTDYTAAGPIENTIYVPTHGGQGAISPQVIGGDFDPKDLCDIEYFRDKLFGVLKVPKQFFGQTDDSTGFNGGSSLSIISSRYGKTIKRMQSILKQMVTDILNLFLISRGMSNYVNKFSIHMQAPVTQEELDERSNRDTKLRSVSDIMGQLTDIEDKVIKMKIYRSLVGTVLTDGDVLSQLDAYIQKLEEEASKKEEEETEGGEESGESADEGFDFGGGSDSGGGMDLDGGDLFGGGAETAPAEEAPAEAPAEEAPMPTMNDALAAEESFYNNSDKPILNEDDSYLPTPGEIGLEF